MNEPMKHATATPFEGDAARAFDAAVLLLTNLGFRVVARSDSSLELVGPGMNSSREAALVGASRIEFRHGRGELTVEAELGGVRQMARFVSLFPLGLCLFLAVLLTAVFHLAGFPPWAATIVLTVTGLNAIVWFFLAPIMARSMRTRTCRALDALVGNVASMGR